MKQKDSKVIMLGTALWGWGVDKETAHRMLDLFIDRGGQWIDTATNYPINANPEDFGRANQYIANWLISNPSSDLQIFCKIGSLDNSGKPDCNLSASAILTSTEILRGIFFEQLAGIACHWDNRFQENEITETIDAIEILHKEGFQIGFSGVKYPEIYRRCAPQLSDQWWIQVKENANTRYARDQYSKYFPSARYIAYGINMGGVKTSPDHYRSNSSMNLRKLEEPDKAVQLRRFLSEIQDIEPRPKTLNELAMLATYANPEIHGFIIGPRSIEQLQQSLDYLEALRSSSAASIQQVQARIAEAGIWS
ncbi:aldo/keto reductase [Allochromatium vinosum]|uniref:aldo/keto reductase n=1 Tax=Allochromatium vinosum TaxID=1049 RepID=UPI001903DA1F|nr:aldo/keto reductase [Allochromatium vinosum]MBK1656096.1 hypothetical protein [Allochromatium vinosum]